jgi:hypothetical protein
VELLGFSGLDPATGELIQTPVHVQWLLKREDGYDILIRTETPHGGLEELLQKPRVEPMALGVTNISIGAFTGLEDGARDKVHTVTAARRSFDEPGHWAAMPRILQLIVYGPDNILLVNELIYR